MKVSLLLAILFLSIPTRGHTQGTQYNGRNGSVSSDLQSTIISTFSLPKRELPIQIKVVEDKEFLKMCNEEREANNSKIWVAFNLPENSNSVEIFFKKSEILLDEKNKVEMERRGKEVRHLLDILYPTTYQYKQRFGMMFDYTVVGDTNGNLTQRYEDNFGTDIIPIGQGFLFIRNGFYGDQYKVGQPNYSLKWERKRVPQSGVIMLELKDTPVKKTGVK